MKKISILLASAIFAMSMVFTAQASESDPTYGFGEGYRWQYNCDSSADVTSVTFTNYVNPPNDATSGLLKSCSVVVMVYFGEHYFGWDFDDPQLIGVIEIAEGLDVPILFQLVHRGMSLGNSDNDSPDEDESDFSPPELPPEPPELTSAGGSLAFPISGAYKVV